MLNAILRFFRRLVGKKNHVSEINPLSDVNEFQCVSGIITANEWRRVLAKREEGQSGVGAKIL